MNTKRKDISEKIHDFFWPEEKFVYMPRSREEEIEKFVHLLIGGLYDGQSALIKAKELGIEKDHEEITKKCFAHDCKKWLFSLRKNELSKADRVYAIGFIRSAVRNKCISFSELGTNDAELDTFIQDNQVMGILGKGSLPNQWHPPKK